MKQRGFILNNNFRWFLYAVFLLLEGSGIFWIILRYFYAKKGEFGIEYSSAQPLVLSIHGALAMISLVVIGAIIPTHAYLAWKAKKNVTSGYGLSAILVFLIISGYLLYYVGNAEVREWTSLLHWVVGIILVPIISLHIYLGRRINVKSILI